MSQNKTTLHSATKIQKDELIWRVQHLNDQALFAKSCDTLARQFSDFKESYPMAIAESASFYFVSYQAWMFSSSMSLAKLYDKDSKSGGLRFLLTEFRKSMSLFAQREPYIIPYSPSSLTAKDCHDQFNSKMKGLEPCINKLWKQRKKLLAHNDQASNFDLSIPYGKDGLTEKERSELLDFAIELTCFCYYALTGKQKPKIQPNIDGWQKTIKIVEEHRDHSGDALWKEFGIM